MPRCIAVVTPPYSERVNEDLLFSLMLAVPLGIPAVASFIAPDRVRWVIGVGVALAAGLVLLILVAPGDDSDGEWDTGTELLFGLSVAGAGLLLWMVGSACGWATRRTVQKARAKSHVKLT